MMEADSASETLDFPIDIPPDDDPSVALLEEDRRNNQIHATSGDASTPPLLTEPTPSERRLRELAQQSHDDEINVGDFIGMGNFADHPDHMMDTADVTISLDPNILPGPYTLNCVLKSSSICYILYLGLLSSILVGGLIANGTATCEKPLIAWAAVESALFLMMMVKSVGIFFDVPARIAAMDRNSNIRRYMMGFMYIGHRVLNFVWFVWFIFGAVWTMDAKSKCSDEAFAIWVTTLVVVVIQMSMFALVGLIVCGACCCFCFCYFFASSRFEGNKGASKKLIEKTTKTETYSTESTQIAKEDAICAICLSDYNEGDNLRYLPCGHHFHSECVDQWLLTNKSCASCRRLIDSPPPAAGEKEKEKEAEDTTNMAVPAVGPDNV